MPRFLDNVETKQIPGSSFQYSAVRPEKLGATEYTLVTILADKTGSVEPFSQDIIKMIQEVVNACKKNSRSENLMIRFVTFNDNIYEVHGFLPLADIDMNLYSTLNCGGTTALFDATYSVVSATNDYAKILLDQDFDVNGAIYIITDGDDNASTMSVNNVKKAIEEAKRKEVIESLITVLIALNTSACGNSLKSFKDQGGLTHYIDVGDVNAGKLAKLGGWISKSISSTSQSLGTGNASATTNLTF